MFDPWDFQAEQPSARDLTHTLKQGGTDFFHGLETQGRTLTEEGFRTRELLQPLQDAALGINETLKNAALDLRELMVDAGLGATDAIQQLGPAALDLIHTFSSWGYDLIDLLSQEREEREREERGDGSQLAAPPEWIPNYFDEGWIPGCQYFVYLRIHDPNGFHEELNNPWANAWSLSGEGGLRTNDMILPIWGPVVGIRQVYLTSDPNPNYRLSIVCGGFGCGPIFMDGELHSAITDRFYVPSFLGKLSTTYAGGSAFLFPGISSRYRYRPHNELWITPPRREFIRGRIEEVSSIYERFLNILRGKTAYLIGVRRASSIPSHVYPDGSRAIYGSPCAPRPVPPPPLPPPRQTPPPMSCSCNAIAELIDRRFYNLYKILGFPVPSRGGAGMPPPINLNPESLIETAGKSVYAGNDAAQIQVKDLPGMMATIASAVYFRAGYHRLPAEVPKSLTADRSSNDVVLIEDAQSWQEWQFKQLDALLGQFPLQIKVKDEDNKEHIIKFQNLAEALAELAGLSLAISTDVDFAANLAYRAVLEASKAGNAALIAQDYAKANAQFLGYKGNKTERKILSTVTPDKTKKSEFLQKSQQTIIGWQAENEVLNDNLLASLKELLLAAGIIKAALLHPWSEGQPITGDYMRESQVGTESSDEQWEEFLAARRNPPANRQVSARQPEIKDLSRESGNDNGAG